MFSGESGKLTIIPATTCRYAGGENSTRRNRRLPDSQANIEINGVGNFYTSSLLFLLVIADKVVETLCCCPQLDV
jgi:hypothetical protein